MLKPLNPFQIKLPEFEGPLDLLLYLIEREELDITKVSLAQVTGSYLEYIHLLEKLQVDQVADFLVVAAKLLLIKSEALLPRPPEVRSEGEEDVGDDLVRQLLLYKQYKETARVLGEREAAGLHTYVRVAPPPKIDAKLDLSNITIDMLLTAVRNALEIEKPGPPVGSVVKPFTLTIREHYAGFAGTATLFIASNGVGSITYSYTNSGEDLNCRELSEHGRRFVQASGCK